MKNILIVAFVLLSGLIFAGTTQAQTIEITDELLTHTDGFIDYFDHDWLEFKVSGDTGGEPMMIRYGVQLPNSTTYYWSQFWIVNGPYTINGAIPCAFNGWTQHAESYLVAAELRTYSYFTMGDFVVDDVAFFNHD